MVVVGAGAAGVPAALSAAESGASVAVLQKHPMPVSQGNTGSGIDLATSDPAGVEALVSKLMADNNHRANPALLREWAYHSGEAVRWVIDRTKKGGGQVVDQGSGPQVAIRKVNGYTLNYVTSFMGPKPYTTGDGMPALATVAERAGVKFFFRMPAQQLVQAANGQVQGVIAQGKDGQYRRFMARKGVILATGDYQNNKAMCDYFVPDIKHLGRKMMDRTGDGFAMAYWEGRHAGRTGHQAADQRHPLRGHRQALQRNGCRRQGHRVRQGAGVADPGRQAAVLRHPPPRARVHPVLGHAGRRQAPGPGCRRQAHPGSVPDRQPRRRLLRRCGLSADRVRAVAGSLPCRPRSARTTTARWAVNTPPKA